MPLSSQMNDQQPLFLDRELSWLEFNRRVLEQAGDRSVPLFERLKFLSIYHSNLDEFFMVRIGSLGDQALVNPEKQDEKTGWTAAGQISMSLERVRSFVPLLSQIYEELAGGLHEQGVEIVDCSALTRLEELLFLQRFTDEIEPLLSPLVIDRSHPFPFLGNKEQYVITRLDAKDGKMRVGLVGMSQLPPYLIVTVDQVKKLAFLPDLVCRFAGKIFEKQKVRERMVIRITRNADISIDEALDDNLDFRGIMQGLLKKRRRLAAVRMQCSRQPSPELLSYLCGRLSLTPDRVMAESTPLDLSFGFSLPGLLSNLSPTLFYPDSSPVHRFDGQKKELLRLFSEKETLLSFPFESIRTFIELLGEAADDPSVLSIQISLYRLAAHSRIAEALCRAAGNGKQVTCLLELRARFDEQSNINYAQLLEEAGCTVIYGLDDYKTHAKLCLITMRKHGKLFTITQVGTGNYNEKTSEQYTDLSLITPDAQVGQDAGRIFAALCKSEIPERLEHLWVAPFGFKPRLLELIREETEYAQQGEAGIIEIKVNSLNDLEVMQALIEASRAGVRILLIVRGLCCLRPGIPGSTENVTVKSIVGRYLEHSRIFAFGTGERRRLWIGSGDLLNRNTRRRVEVFAEVRSAASRHKLEEILERIRRDNVNGWIMRPDGGYERCPRGGMRHDSHHDLRELAAQESSVQSIKALPKHPFIRLRDILHQGK